MPKLDDGKVRAVAYLNICVEFRNVVLARRNVHHVKGARQIDT